MQNFLISIFDGIAGPVMFLAIITASLFRLRKNTFTYFSPVRDLLFVPVIIQIGWATLLLLPHAFMKQDFQLVLPGLSATVQGTHAQLYFWFMLSLEIVMIAWFAKDLMGYQIVFKRKPAKLTILRRENQSDSAQNTNSDKKDAA